jgi:hypothetical protein
MIRLILLALLPIVAFADSGTIAITEGGGIALSCDKTCPTGEPVVCPTSEPSVCPPVPTLAPIILPSPGNLHGSTHVTRTKDLGLANCKTCHTAGGSAVVSSDRTICSRFSFLPAGRVLMDPITGQPARDPLSGYQVVSGGSIAVLQKGETVFCSTCHTIHNDKTQRPTASMITEGCAAECHVAVGNSKLQPGVHE